jgi:hypothetical protein
MIGWSGRVSDTLNEFYNLHYYCTTVVEANFLYDDEIVTGIIAGCSSSTRKTHCI